MSKGGSPEKPNYNKVTKGAKNLSKKAGDLANKQFKWAKKTYKADKKVTNALIADMQGIIDSQMEDAELYGEQYENVFMPLHEQNVEQIAEYRARANGYRGEAELLKKQAAEYGSETNIKAKAGRATADVAQSMDIARKTATRELESYGLNPSATRYGALDIGVRTSEAAAKAAAATEMIQTTEDTSRDMYNSALDRELQAMGLDAEAMNMELGLITVGQSIPGQVAQANAGAVSAGGTAADMKLNTTRVGNETRQGAVPFMNVQNAALGTWAETLNMGFENELAAYKTEQESSSGIGSILGSVAGLASSFIPGFEKGGAVEDPAVTSPGNVPASASPSGGGAVDDVAARLNVGEFVIPEETVRWQGEKFFQNLIMKAAQEKADATAKPTPIRQTIPHPAMLNGAARPSAGALPV